MQGDPIGEVRKLCARLDEPVTDDFEQGMRRWRGDHAETREVNVHPDASAFGLELDQVRELFADYTARVPDRTAPTAPAG